MNNDKEEFTREQYIIIETLIDCITYPIPKDFFKDELIGKEVNYLKYKYFIEVNNNNSTNFKRDSLQSVIRKFNLYDLKNKLNSTNIIIRKLLYLFEDYVKNIN